jgi:hypothetical protein
LWFRGGWSGPFVAAPLPRRRRGAASVSCPPTPTRCQHGSSSSSAPPLRAPPPCADSAPPRPTARMRLLHFCPFRRLLFRVRRALRLCNLEPSPALPRRRRPVHLLPPAVFGHFDWAPVGGRYPPSVFGRPTPVPRPSPLNTGAGVGGGPGRRCPPSLPHLLSFSDRCCSGMWQVCRRPVEFVLLTSRSAWAMVAWSPRRLFLVAIISGTRCDSHCLVFHFGSGGWQCHCWPWSSRVKALPSAC